jgi:uncharacterized iron-regulated membrane protein
MMMKLLSFISLFLFLGFAQASNLTFYDYTQANVPAGQTLGYPSGSTVVYSVSVKSTPINTNSIYACDTSGKLMKLASGSTLAATDLFWLPVSGCQMFTLNPVLPAGTQLSLKGGQTTSAGVPTTGYNSLSFFP